MEEFRRELRPQRARIHAGAGAARAGQEAELGTWTVWGTQGFGNNHADWCVIYNTHDLYRYVYIYIYVHMIYVI